MVMSVGALLILSALPGFDLDFNGQNFKPLVLRANLYRHIDEGAKVFGCINTQERHF